MSPTEEQILRNQTAIISMLRYIVPESDAGLISLKQALLCLKETSVMLQVEAQQGRTVHAYPA